jgi:hypothetical protein
MQTMQSVQTINSLSEEARASNLQQRRLLLQGSSSSPAGVLAPGCLNCSFPQEHKELRYVLPLAIAVFACCPYT